MAIDTDRDVVRKSLIAIIFVAVDGARTISEPAAVNRRVAGSSPAWGATPIKPTKSATYEDRGRSSA